MKVKNLLSLPNKIDKITEAAYRGTEESALLVWWYRVGRGSKKVPSGCPGQVDFCVAPVTFPTRLPDGEGYGQGYEQAARELS